MIEHLFKIRFILFFTMYSSLQSLINSEVLGTYDTKMDFPYVLSPQLLLCMVTSALAMRSARGLWQVPPPVAQAFTHIGFLTNQGSCLVWVARGTEGTAAAAAAAAASTTQCRYMSHAHTTHRESLTQRLPLPTDLRNPSWLHASGIPYLDVQYRCVGKCQLSIIYVSEISFKCCHYAQICMLSVESDRCIALGIEFCGLFPLNFVPHVIFMMYTST